MRSTHGPVLALSGRAVLSLVMVLWWVVPNLLYADQPGGRHGERRAIDRHHVGSFHVRVHAPMRTVPKGAIAPHAGTHSVRVDVRKPLGRMLDRVEIYVDRTLRRTLHEPQFTLDLDAVPTGPYAITAVAYLDNGERAEDVLLANAISPPENVDVHDVELWVGAFDRRNRAAHDLEVEQFTILENGVPQTIERFRPAHEAPLTVGILADVSPTMTQDGALDEAVARAGDFLSDILRPGDRAGLFTFREKPEVVAPFGDDLDALRAALEGVTVDRSWAGTAIHDSVAEVLRQFDNQDGRRALLVITDGLDNRSQRLMPEVIMLARRAGVRVYAFLVGRRALGPALVDLARETGGTSHRVRHPVDLARVYRRISRELRGQYLVGYRSSWAGKDDTRCRRVEVAIAHEARALTARAMRRYCP